MTGTTVALEVDAATTMLMNEKKAYTSSPDDPFGMRSGIITDVQIEGLRKREKGKAVGKYQAQQNNLISALLKPIEDHSEDAKAEEEATRLPVKIAVYTSLLCNLALCILQLYAAISSVSLSLLTTAIDSVFDICSNIWLFFIHRQAARLSGDKWPVGGSRLETIGNIVYGALMGSVSLVVIVEATRSLITKKGDALSPFHLPSILSVGVALCVKLLLFLYCYSTRNNSGQVRILWQDHRNDLWINGFGIIMSTAGSKLRWYLDPIGAIIISLGIIFSWGCTIYGEFELLGGKAASHDLVQLVIYKAATFSDVIEKVSQVRAYHSGPECFVEIHVVMNAHTPLSVAHDICERLQNKIESLPQVGRAFVQVDYEWDNLVVDRQRLPRLPKLSI